MGYSTKPVFMAVDSAAGKMSRRHGKASICELGNQRLFMKDITGVPNGTPAGDVFRKKYNYTCIDINGKDGAVKLDLSKPIPANGGQVPLNSFHVVTNIGTSEHVQDQFNCFRNIHRLCAPGGLMVHALPVTGSWPDHGLVHYMNFFLCQLSLSCKYKTESEAEIVKSPRGIAGQNQLMLAVLSKTGFNFCSAKEWEKIKRFIT